MGCVKYCQTIVSFHKPSQILKDHLSGKHLQNSCLEHTNILPHQADWNWLKLCMDHLYPDHKVAFPHMYIRTHMHTQCWSVPINIVGLHEDISRYVSSLSDLQRSLTQLTLRFRTRKRSRRQGRGRWPYLALVFFSFRCAFFLSFTSSSSETVFVVPSLTSILQLLAIMWFPETLTYSHFHSTTRYVPTCLMAIQLNFVYCAIASHAKRARNFCWMPTC